MGKKIATLNALAFHYERVCFSQYFSTTQIMDTIHIIEPDNTFAFDKCSLGTLTTVAGGSYFARLYFNNKPLYIQSPKSLTKQGFVRSGKKYYTDLMFTNQDELFIHWLENLESTCQQLLFSKNAEWFTPENKLEMHDIESCFTSPVKVFRSGRFYLVRTNIKPNIKIYDEQVAIPAESIISDTHIVSVIEVQGIKFTSNTFQIELEIKQCLKVSADPFLDSCVIKAPLVKTGGTQPVRPNPTEPKEASKIMEAMDKDEEEEIFKMIAQAEATKVEPSHEPLTPVQSQPKNIKAITQNNTKQNSQTTISPEQIINGNTSKLTVGANISNNDIGEITVLDMPEITTDIQDLTNVDISLDNSLETITLKKPNQVYYEIYNEARKKAKECKKAAIIAYLEAKNIKKTYMLESDSESDGSDYSESDLNELEDLDELEEMEEVEE